MEEGLEELEARTTALLAGPVGCAFLLIADASGLASEAAARPAVSMHIAACSVDAVSRWRSDHDAMVATMFERSAGRGNLARAVLASPDAAWWFRPLDRTQQLWLSRDASGPDPTRLNVAKSTTDPWERYAQKPAQGLYTSTLVDGTSSLLAALAEGAGDLVAAFPARPLACWRLEASPAARVFEVDGPQAWHDLCVRYPAIGEGGRLVPAWSAVAQDWDAVHLTFGGLLTAEQVRVESPTGWTQLWGWDCEQTVWFHWCFIAAVRLSDIELPLLPQIHLRRP